MIPGRGKFFWRLFTGNALLLVAVVITCGWLILRAFDRFYAQDLSQHLTTLAKSLRYQVQDRFDQPHAGELDRLAKAVGTTDANGVRVTFVLADGTVLGDSHADPALMESHADRREIRQALQEGRGESTRWSHTVSRDMKYVAVRIGSPESPRGVVRVSMGARSIVARTAAARQLFRSIALVGLGAAVVLALGLARVWSRPIAHITATARSLSQGDLSARARVTGTDEVALLAQSLNQMRDHLAGQLETIDHQRRTVEHLLTQLHEGVVVARADGRLVLVNPAAARLLDLPRTNGGRVASLEGQTVESCIARRELQDMLTAGPQSEPPAADGAVPTLQIVDREGTTSVQERRLTLDRPGGGVTLLARASDIVLPGGDGSKEGDDPAGRTAGPGAPIGGRLLVLTDITELARTLQVKTDFVMNASHELRTPLSAIRAAVETLMTMDLATDTASAKQIVSVINRHSARLGAMVADLLDLSRIESGTTELRPATVRVGEIAQELHSRFANRLAEKKQRWEVRVPPDDVTLTVSPVLLNLVLANLVDNAIKFTPDAGSVTIDAWLDHQECHVRVSDTGCGIAQEEQERVFERFYQVERARTGTDRGTGLGLSIVRHAVHAMKGQVHLDSRPGEGTRVTVTIPQPQ